MPVQQSPPNVKRQRTPPEDNPNDQSNVQELFLTPTNRNRESLLPCDFETKDDDDLLAIDLQRLRLSDFSTHPERRTTVMAKSEDGKPESKEQIEDEGTDCATSISQMTRARADIDKYVNRIEKLESDGSNVTRWTLDVSYIYAPLRSPYYW